MQVFVLALLLAGISVGSYALKEEARVPMEQRLFDLVTKNHEDVAGMIGECTTQEANDYIEGSIYFDICANQMTSAFETDDYEVIYNTYCSPACSAPFLGLFYEICNTNGNLVERRYTAPCTLDDFERVCGYEMYSSEPHPVDVVLAAESVCGGDTCSEDCASMLTTVRDQIGCCVNTYLNDTELMEAVWGAGRQAEAFTDYGLWVKCQVIPPGLCDPYPTPSSRSSSAGARAGLAVLLAVALLAPLSLLQ